MITKEKYIETARAYLGTVEGTPKHKSIVAAYNAIKPLPRGYRLNTWDAWCAGFVSAIASLAGFGDGFPYECSVQQMVNQAKKMKLWAGKKAVKVGWLAVYDWQKDSIADHVGVVIDVTTKQIKVLEGNYRDTVRVRTIAKDSDLIKGYIALKYIDSNLTSNENVAREVIAGKWGDGETRKKKLTKAGYDPAAIQKIVNKLLKG